MDAKTSSGPGDWPALDATIGEVEGGLAQIEEGVVAVGFGNQQLRRAAAFAAAEAGGEIGTAVRIGHRCAEHFVVARNELDRRIGDRLGRGQRADEGVDAVVAGDRGEAQIGDDEPLRREVRPVVGLAWCS